MMVNETIVIFSAIAWHILLIAKFNSLIVGEKGTIFNEAESSGSYLLHTIVPRNLLVIVWYLRFRFDNSHRNKYVIWFVIMSFYTFSLKPKIACYFQILVCNRRGCFEYFQFQPNRTRLDFIRSKFNIDYS
jgi:hypothetical protein